MAATGLTATPYSLRHAGVSIWLNAGLRNTEIAARAGHSVQVLLATYAGCVQGQDRTANQLIEDELNEEWPM